MVTFPNCKINIGLNVIGKRTDGYHDIETVFYPIAVKDALEVLPSKKFNFQLSGIAVNGSTDQNLCVKAFNLLKKDFPGLPQVSIHLHKAIPTGAGLGGGSADGAFMLLLLNEQFELKLTQEKLISYALQLGSDCPFFIHNTPCFATGRGENLTPVEFDLSLYKIVLVNPAIQISTKEAFARLTLPKPLKNILHIIHQPIQTWKDDLKNDFEESVFQLFPSIKMIKDELYNLGALYSSMTGSGSTVFGIFKSTDTFDFSFPEPFTCIIV